MNMGENIFNDYYKILQVHYEASSAVINAAYRETSSENMSEASRKKLDEAYACLSDPQKRKEYHALWMQNNSALFADKNQINIYSVASPSKNFNPDTAYKEILSEHDELTGLLNENGFYRWAALEEKRYNRYHDPITVLVFQIICDDKHIDSCVADFAKILTPITRQTDINARLKRNQLICLLTGTEKNGGEMTASKIMNNIHNRALEKYEVHYGIVFFNGFSSLREAVEAASNVAASNI
jgi:GGDEF domain-containing protein